MLSSLRTGLRKFVSRFWLYILNWILLVDLIGNTLLGGDPRETLSSRMGKQMQEGDCVLCGWICYLLDRLDPDHCQASIDPHRGDGSGPRDRNVWN